MLGQQREDPSPAALLEAFTVLDREGAGTIPEQQFRRIMLLKVSGEEEAVEEMVAEYRRHNDSGADTTKEERLIDYKKFVAMLRL